MSKNHLLWAAGIYLGIGLAYTYAASAYSNPPTPFTNNLSFVFTWPYQLVAGA